MATVEGEVPATWEEGFEAPSEENARAVAAFILALPILIQQAGSDAEYDLRSNPPGRLPDFSQLGGERRISIAELSDSLGPPSIDLRSRRAQFGMMREAYEDLMSREDGSLLPTGRLLASGLSSPFAVIRAASGIAWTRLVEDPIPGVIAASAAAASTVDPDVQAMVAAGLGHSLRAEYEWRHPREKRGVGVVHGPDALLVHGTQFACHGRPVDQWWKPGTGELHNYLRSGTRPNIYGESDHFQWSGGWNDFARTEAGHNLADWCRVRGLDGIDVITHSHGGNVACLASRQCRFGRMILLSCPVHDYRPDFLRVGEVISVRINWDLVIMGDRGGQRFHDTRIKEVVLPFWYLGHDATRKAQTWSRESIDGWLQ